MLTHIMMVVVAVTMRMAVCMTMWFRNGRTGHALYGACKGLLLHKTTHNHKRTLMTKSPLCM